MRLIPATSSCSDRTVAVLGQSELYAQLATHRTGAVVAWQAPSLERDPHALRSSRDSETCRDPVPFGTHAQVTSPSVSTHACAGRLPAHALPGPRGEERLAPTPCRSPLGAPSGTHEHRHGDARASNPNTAVSRVRQRGA